MSPTNLKQLDIEEKKNVIRFRPSFSTRRRIRKFNKPKKFQSSRVRVFGIAKRLPRGSFSRKISLQILKAARSYIRELLKDCKQIAALANRATITRKDLRLAERIRGIKPRQAFNLLGTSNLPLVDKKKININDPL